MKPYNKQSEYWDQFLTDDQIIEECKKMPFIRYIANEHHVTRSWVSRVIREAGLA